MSRLIVRELRAEDIALIDGYWSSLSEADIARMHIDAPRVVTGAALHERLRKAIDTPARERLVDPMIWELDGRSVGFTNMNNFDRAAAEADIHLHMVDESLRGKGFGKRFFAMALERYFERHALEKIVCEPASTNPGPNALLRSLGFTPVRTYRKTSAYCFEHEVHRYEIRPGDVPRLS